MRLLACIGTLAALAATAADDVTDPQAAIREVESGARPVANAAWWGFNPEDATESLQAAIDSNADSVVVPYMSTPWIVRPLKLRSDLTILFKPGVIVEAKRGEYKGKGDSLFTADAAENLRLTGYGATLRMHKEDYRKEPYEKAEWRMVLAINSCTNVSIEGLRLESSGGDGIYIGASNSAQPYCKDVTIRDVSLVDQYRQGISVISAENLLIENCVMSGTEGTPPAAGIDFEPNGHNERLTNCVVKNCVFADNEGPGIQAYLAHMKASSDPVSILVESCIIRSGAGDGVVIGRLTDDAPQGHITFRECTIVGANFDTVHIYDKSATSARLIFENCAIDMRNNADTQHVPIRLKVDDPVYAAVHGGVTFQNCTVFDDHDRPFLRFATEDDSIGLRDVHGSVKVHSPHGARIDVPETATEINVATR